MKETKSNWECVSEQMKDVSPVFLHAHHMTLSPRQLLHRLSYYKFAAKLIGKQKRVLDLSCREGLGTYLLAKECGFAQGIEEDGPSLSLAKKTFPSEAVQFFPRPPEKESAWDAVVHYQFCEPFRKNSESFATGSYSYRQVASHLAPHGIAVIGAPLEEGTFSPSKRELLKAEMGKHFAFLFFFPAVGEWVRTSCEGPASYLIRVGCKAKR